MIMMTMRSSSSENARSARPTATPCRRRQVPHRQEHAEREDQYERAHHHEEDRLDLRRQALDLDRHLALVHVGDLGHEGVDLAGLLAYRDHLQHHRVEHARGHRGAQDAFAALDAVAHLQDARFEVGVVDHARHHRERLHDRHAALAREREAAREARERRLMDELADHRQLELEAIPAVAPGWGSDIDAETYDESDQDYQQERPVSDENVGSP